MQQGDVCCCPLKMKNALFFILILMLACTKQAQPDVPLTGYWKMTDSYIGRGDGSISHQKVVDVIFRFTSTDSLYRLYGDVFHNTKLTGITDSSFVAEESALPYRYEITGDKMEIEHPCDEGCKWLFRKNASR